jgi:hypothetical protein
MFLTRLTATLLSFVCILVLLFVTTPQRAEADYNEKEVGVFDEHRYNSRQSGRHCFNIYVYFRHKKAIPNRSNTHWNTYHASGSSSGSHPSHGVSHVFAGRSSYQHWLKKCPGE